MKENTDKKLLGFNIANYELAVSPVCSILCFTIALYYNLNFFLVLAALYAIDGAIYLYCKWKSPEFHYPYWWNNSYFGFSIFLFAIAIYGTPWLGGDTAIRDNARTDDSNLYIYYFLAGIVLVLNGLINNVLTAKQKKEHTGSMSNLDNLFR